MNQSEKPRPEGFLTLTLHAHLPYVVNHGTWPHGLEWLHEAAAETYLPLLRVLGRLEKDGIGLHCNLVITPVLMEQLAHPVFLAEFPNYLTRKIVAAREDEAFFTQSGESHYAETARFWHRFFTQALDDFNTLDGSILGAFRRFHEKGLIEIITCCATHGYLPLLGTDESVRAQIRTAVTTHKRHIGEHPKGIWVPECGYRPAGYWNYPVNNQDGSHIAGGFTRIGVEQALSESDIKFFFVDTHLVEESAQIDSPYSGGNRHLATHPRITPQDPRSLYQPYYVTPYNNEATQNTVTVFPRDPRTGVQVWSGESGYPGDSNYLDFHKKRWPGGHRYWRVTGPQVDMGNKEPYYPQDAAARIQSHASHFVHLIHEALAEARKGSAPDAPPPILCAPFDAELFGHWWFEGPQWLEAVARTLHDYPTGLELTTCSTYLDQYPRAGSIAMHEGSWGAEGTNEVWLNPETSWTYTHIYPAELYVRQVCTGSQWRSSELATRIVQQLCRELLLLESSDWQFLITTGAARDYAELRFMTHNDQYLELKGIWEAYSADGQLNEHQSGRLAAIEQRDSIFADLDPAFWAAGASEPGA
ncbi:1,4-alpha-glucan branching protein domain-containing protein [Granulicella tundricola]|uniref:Glycoside hydrolase family 57 n=1 Tax=Granulicella tundricola (strain ATCC BAA-1859 / DSM 23138 / MP5ACTX9) TaxID=1198114 RepID=E8X2A8_GRATM|nr:1,4-alpha-glucan branching protein domain-containing protein [Granulicella tundricola]ADW68040.1 glycoside hydrolase family 57 [Granulicella tundricola MP5ACTX9]